MSKNNKKKTSVSILTITQLKRSECLDILIDLINAQTYKNIIEWVLVEGSKSREDKDKNAIKIKELQENSVLKFPIIYIDTKDNTKLGELRNIGNNSCKGDITVCMDDDDFYPKTRVSHAVEKLTSSPCKIAGCSALYMYDYILERLYKFKEFMPYHSTNTCMAWKKEYLLTNQHDPDKDLAEEPSFTKNFTEPMIQLDAEHTNILSSHTFNTFNKRELCTSGTMKINPKMDEVNVHISNFIDEKIYSRYRKLFVNVCDNPYDIVYFCGGFSIKWDPADMKLGGSEQAVVNLSTNWAKLGKKVAVYGEVPDKTLNGVDYFNWQKFPFEQNFNIVILWRLYGLDSGASFKIKAKEIWFDIHDRFFQQFNEKYERLGGCINKIFLKSDNHLQLFKEAFKEEKDISKCIVIPNGIRIEQFIENTENITRNPYRFCYCSCYTRGLQQIIEKIWPVIYNYEPRAELHVYYGMDMIQDQNYKNYMSSLLARPGVMDHGRQPMEMIIREKYYSNFQLYITNSLLEIDCISIRESLVTGCIPLLSNSGVFKERDGIHFDLTEDDKTYGLIAVKIIQLLKKYDEMNNIREKLKDSPSIINWEDVSKKWLDNVSNT